MEIQHKTIVFNKHAIKCLMLENFRSEMNCNATVQLKRTEGKGIVEPKLNSPRLNLPLQSSEYESNLTRAAPKMDMLTDEIQPWLK